MTRPLLILACLAAVPTLAPAQHRGTIELGAFGRYGVYDDTLNMDDAPGFGARLGLFLSGKLSLEGDWAIASGIGTNGGPEVEHMPVHVRLLGNLPVGKRMQFLLGGGWAYSNYTDDTGLDVSENGIGGLAGLRINLGQRLALRGDVIVDYMFSDLDVTPGEDDARLNYALQAGVSLMLFGGPGDKDKDKVKDDVDKCPDTPAGTPVEATGCPDADRDGIANTGDRCANTPAGLKVDAVGCTDADGDGVVDPQDRCASTPAGTPVDATGCQPDADKDGVFDSADKCANTPAGVQVDVTTGCPTDSDADGVPEAADRCPGTPAGVAVDATGCASDADGDGVPNTADRCAGTAAGTRVDSAGCPEVTAIVLEGVTFLSGSAKLTLNSQGPLNKAVAELQTRPDVKVLIEGHTDNVGNRDANIRISKARADAVRAYFISKGIAANRLTTVGIGPDQPVAGNDTAEGRSKNRRVQLRVQN